MKKLFALLSVFVVLGLLAACAAPTPQVVEVTKEVQGRPPGPELGVHRLARPVPPDGSGPVRPTSTASQGEIDR